MGGVGRYATQDDVVLKAEFQDLEDLMRPKTVTYKHLWVSVSSFFGLGIKYMLKPF
jgi:hypothetical protein